MRLHCATALIGDQWRHGVVLEVNADGAIVRVETAAPQPADTLVHGVVIPGMPNAHSHAFQRLIAGMTGPRGRRSDSFWSWREAMYGAANRISPEHFTAVAAWVFVEMLKAGYTSCAEFHYLHHQADGRPYAGLAEMSGRLVEAATASGIAMTLLPVLYCRSGFGEPGVRPEQRRFANNVQGYLRLLEQCRSLTSADPRLCLGVAPHSLRAVPGALLQEVLTSWGDRDCPVHIHIAEQPAEVEACRAHLGARPLEWLLEHFDLDRRWCLVHATHVSDRELTLAAASGATAGVCPTTEADLGDGAFRSAAWLEAGGSLAIGSDSNVRISVGEELRLLEYNERMRSGRRNVLTTPDTSCGRFLYQHAAGAGAAALGQKVGRLEPGCRADLLELDAGHELLAGKDPDAALDSWVFAGDASMLNSVWVAGRRLIDGGRHASEASLRAGFAGALSAFLQGDG